MKLTYPREKSVQNRGNKNKPNKRCMKMPGILHHLNFHEMSIPIDAYSECLAHTLRQNTGQKTLAGDREACEVLKRNTFEKNNILGQRRSCTINMHIMFQCIIFMTYRFIMFLPVWSYKRQMESNNNTHSGVKSTIIRNHSLKSGC